MSKYDLFAFEGGDGTGKTTIVTKVVDSLERKGYKVAHIRSPGGTPLGERLRSVILNENFKSDVYTQVCIFFASHFQMIDEYINRDNSSDILIVDRFDLSTRAYQSQVAYFDALDQGMSKQRALRVSLEVEEAIEKMREIMHKKLKVGYFIVDANDKSVHQRITNRDQLDQFDARNESFHRRIRSMFDSMSDEDIIETFDNSIEYAHKIDEYVTRACFYIEKLRKE